jgi:hypothetical protein
MPGDPNYCPGDCYCGNGTCDFGESTFGSPEYCPAECVAAPYCGDGVCDSGAPQYEDAYNCYKDPNLVGLESNGDCQCGDSVCDGLESSSTVCQDYHCNFDCSYDPYCGNGICDFEDPFNESINNCKLSDLAAPLCDPNVGPFGDCYCGDGVCDSTETLLNPGDLHYCPGDCGGPVCGDGICEMDQGENYSNCPSDEDPDGDGPIGAGDCNCGNGVCEWDPFEETAQNCPASIPNFAGPGIPGDCSCGDDVCDITENKPASDPASCHADCGCVGTVYGLCGTGTGSYCCATVTDITSPRFGDALNACTYGTCSPAPQPDARPLERCEDATCWPNYECKFITPPTTSEPGGLYCVPNESECKKENEFCNYNKLRCCAGDNLSPSPSLYCKYTYIQPAGGEATGECKPITGPVQNGCNVFDQAASVPCALPTPPRFIPTNPPSTWCCPVGSFCGSTLNECVNQCGPNKVRCNPYVETGEPNGCCDTTTSACFFDGETNAYTCKPKAACGIGPEVPDPVPIPPYPVGTTPNPYGGEFHCKNITVGGMAQESCCNLNEICNEDPNDSAQNCYNEGTYACNGLNNAQPTQSCRVGDTCCGPNKCCPPTHLCENEGTVTTPNWKCNSPNVV